MFEEILPNIYRIEIPLPRNPLRALNSYLVKGNDRFLLIDTGMNMEECRREMASSLRDLRVDLDRTDFVITHIHADHSGLVGELATETSTVYFNEPETSIIAYQGSQSGYWSQLLASYRAHGFDPQELESAMKGHPGQLYGPRRKVDFCTLKEGDRIEIGDYSFACIETPGHSPGHTCLYDAETGILVSGDHILSDITPNISSWAGMENPLKEYLASLDKVEPLDVDVVLPGHRRVFRDHRARIEELREHHRQRLGEALAALEDGEKSAFEVAPWIRWDVGFGSWDLFPPPQKWFAVGETIAHLKYLGAEGRVGTRTTDERILFSLA